MNAKNTKKGQAGSGRGRPGPKRPYSTIDLKATDVTPAEAAKEALTDSRAAGSSAAADSAFAAPDRKKAAIAPSPAGAAGAAGAGPAASGPFKGRAGKSETGGKDKRAASAAGSSVSGGPLAGSSKAASGTAKPAATASKPARGGGGIGGFFTHMAAGVIGALLALFGLNYAGSQLGLTGLGPTSSLPLGSAATGELARRIALLEKKLAAGPNAGSSGQGPQMADIEQRLAGLEVVSDKVVSLSAAQTKLQRAALDLQKKIGAGGINPELAGRLGALEQTLASLGAAARADPGKAGRIPQLAAISGRVNDLETALKTRINELRRDIVQEIDTRVAATSEASEAARSGAQRLGRDLAAMRTGTVKMDQRLIGLKASLGRVSETLRVVQEETGGLKAGLDGLTADTAQKFKSVVRSNDVSEAIAPVASKIAALEKNLQGVVRSEQDRQETAERIVLALELGRLKRAMAQGQNFAAELAEVKRVAGSRLDLTALDRHQASGIPTLGALQKAFRPLAYTIIDGETANPGASVVDRLLKGARAMVRVRKVNHAAGDASTEAIVGRMEAALKDGRLGDVLTAAGKLPDEARAPAAAWLKEVKARQLVDQALAAIEDKLKGSLSGRPGGKG